MKKLLALLLIVGLVGCSTYSSPYGPTLFELAALRAVPITNPDGKVTMPKIAISDEDAMRRAEGVKQVWEKRDRRARGLGVGTALTQAGLGFLPMGLSFFFDVAGLGPIINGVSALLGKFIEVIDPSTRMAAFGDGVKMIVEAQNDYLEKQKEHIPNDTFTDAGRDLAKKTDYAIIVVENTVAGKVPSAAEISGATASK